MGRQELFLRIVCFPPPPFKWLCDDPQILHLAWWMFSHYPTALLWSAYIFELQLHFHFIIAIQLQGFSDKQIQSSLASVHVTYYRHSALKYRFYMAFWDIWVKAQTVQSKTRCSLISLVSYVFFVLYCAVSEVYFQTSSVISKTACVFYCLTSPRTQSNCYLLENIFCLSSSMCAEACPSGIPEENSVW